MTGPATTNVAALQAAIRGLDRDQTFYVLCCLLGWVLADVSTEDWQNGLDMALKSLEATKS